MYVLRLNSAKAYESVSLPFSAVAIAVSNPTASPIFIRLGAPDIPSEINADLILPAASALSQPVTGRSFGVAIGDTTLITGGNTSQSGLFSTTIITFLEDGEEIPSYGSYTFQSLSLSDLSHGTIPFSNGSTATYDLGAWGGVIIFLSPTAGSGQGTISISASSDGLTFFPLGQYSFWPSIPVTLLIPRPVRYMRVTFGNSGIAGEPAIAGFYSARASIAEINQIVYTPVGTPITFPYNVGPLSSTFKVLSTSGISSVSVSVSNTTGQNSGELLIETSQAAAGPWQVVTFREQIINPAGGTYASIFRTFGNLGPFTRVTFLNTGITVSLVGNIYFSITVAPDLNGILQSIYSALGDVGQTTNVGQSIYHNLVSIKNDLDQISIYDSNLPNVLIRLTSTVSLLTAYLPYLPNIDSDLVGIAATLVNISSFTSGTNTNISTYIPELLTIRTTLTTISAAIATINSNIATYLPELLTIRTTLATISTTIGTINTNISAMNARAIASTRNPYAGNFNVPAGAAFNLVVSGGVPVFNTGDYLISISAGIINTGVGAAIAGFDLALGTLGAVTLLVYNGMSVATGGLTPTMTTIAYGSPRDGGFLIPANCGNLWVRNNAGAGQLVYNVITAP